jgi:hypothetical protein
LEERGLRKSDAAYEETEQVRAKKDLQKHRRIGRVASHMHLRNMRTPPFVNSLPVILQVNQYGSVLYEARLTPLESRVNETIKACRMKRARVASWKFQVSPAIVERKPGAKELASRSEGDGHAAHGPSVAQACRVIHAFGGHIYVVEHQCDRRELLTVAGHN